MAPVKQFKNEKGEIFASIYADERQGILLDAWRGDFGSEHNLTGVLGYTFAQLKTKHLTYWLSDVSQMEGALEQGADAAFKMFELLLDSSDLEKFAFVTQRPNNPARQKLTHILAEHGIAVKTFDSYPHAVEWLLVPRLSSRHWEQAEVLTF
ncbi:MAG: hypothetical protein H7A09_02750 [Oceanospirillaceae bacterium]|nr:hypothetical protein [Oceanospirillaceae bacterium]